MKKYIGMILMILLVFLIGCKSRNEVTLSPDQRTSPKVLYDEAKKLTKKDSERARLLFKEVMQLFPNSTYAQRAKLGIADSYFKKHDPASMILAAAEYMEFVSLFPKSPDAVYAKYQIGMCYFQRKKKPGRDQSNTLNAIKAFESLIVQYPGTTEAEKAKKHIAEARQLLAQHYFNIGKSNFLFRAYPGAIARFKQVIDGYPEFNQNDELYFLIGRSYMVMGQLDSAISFFQKIINSFPKSKYFKKANKNLKIINDFKARHPKKVVKKEE